MKKKKIFNIISRVFVGIFVVVLLFTLPLIGVKITDDFSYISGMFVGNKSKYQGIIEIWNIDTFESGTSAKSNYLQKMAESFQKQNKGLYILIKNLSEYECLNLLEKGESPDIFSCSYGVASKLKDYVQPFSENLQTDVTNELLLAGTYNDSLYGLAWCMGVYCFISTDTNLTKANFDITSDFKLSQIALDLGYEVKNKNSTKIISSLTYGINSYLLPKMAFSSYNNMGLVSTSVFSLDKNVNTQTQYTAYSKFIAGESVILLGSQRDIARMENRLANGKLSQVFYEPITTFTDLVQFTLLSTSDDVVKLEYCEKFASYITQETNQNKLSSIGMFPVTGQTDVYDNGIMCDIILDISGISGFNNLFTQIDKITSLQ